MTLRVFHCVCGVVAGLLISACEDSPSPGPSGIVSGERTDVTWTNPTDPANSLILSTDEQGYLTVTNSTGTVTYQSKDGGLVGLDLRSEFTITTDNGDPETALPISVVASANTRDQSIALYMLEPDSGILLPILDEPVISHFRKSSWGVPLPQRRIGPTVSVCDGSRRHRQSMATL